jgi:hypothetical protein
VTASAVGLVLATRRPRHPVGWLLMALGLVMILSGAAAAYAPYGLAVRPGALPAVGIVARLYTPAIEAALAILGFVVLLTPTGSPPTPGWLRWGQVSAVAMAVLLVAATVAPGTIDPQVLAEKGPRTPVPTAAPCWPSRPCSRPGRRCGCGRRRRGRGSAEPGQWRWW